MSWRYGYISPLYKKGDVHLASNYRGITVTSCLWKVFTSLLNSRLMGGLEENKCFSDFQFGFRAKKSTVDAAFVLRSVIDEYHSKNKKVFACFVDFKAAFDSVNRNALLFKLNKMGVGGKFLFCVKNMYSEMISCVKINQKLRTEFFDVPLGVRQGCSFSPTLFSCFVNDLPECLLSSAGFQPVSLGDQVIPCLMYADDLVILSESAAGLQCAINCVQKYCYDWQLTINTTKTQVLVFTKGGKVPKDLPVFQYGNDTVLQVVKEYTYLGIIFCSSGLFNKAQLALAEKASRAYYSLRACFGNDIHRCVQMFLHLIDAIIVPIALYGCEVWLHKSVEKQEKTLSFEKLNLQICKYVLGVNKNTTNYACLGELGRYPLWITAKHRLLGFWSRLLVNEGLANTVYNSTLDANHPRAWNKSVRAVLDHTGFSWVFRAQIPLSKNDLRTVKNVLEAQFEQSWSSVITGRTRLSAQGSNKLRTYSLFKTLFQIETYLLSQEINGAHMRALARFRTSNHTLAIEKGRHTIPPTASHHRYCIQCNSGEVEDEIHFLLTCTKHAILRERLLNSIYIVNNNLQFLCKADLFEVLLSDTRFTTHLALFVKSAFENRL